MDERRGEFLSPRGRGFTATTVIGEPKDRVSGACAGRDDRSSSTTPGRARGIDDYPGMGEYLDRKSSL